MVNQKNYSGFLSSTGGKVKKTTGDCTICYRDISGILNSASELSVKQYSVMKFVVFVIKKLLLNLMRG